MIARLAGGVVALMLSACAPQIVPGGPPIRSPELRADRFIAADGAELPMRSWRPDGPARAVVLALHGFNDYSNAFEMAGRSLAARGVASYAYDQRGFGRAPHPGRWPGEAALIGDLQSVAAALRAAHPGVPLYLLGDSMGGALALVALAGPTPPAVDGAVLVAPALWGRATMGPIQRGLLWLAAHTAPWLRLSAQGLEIQASDNVEMLRALSRDPLVIKRTRVDAVHGLVDLMDHALAVADRLAVPSLLLYGAKDEIIPARPIADVRARLPRGAAVRFAYYRGGYHMLLRDLDAETVIGDIAAWLDDHAAPLPSGADQAVAELGR